MNCSFKRYIVPTAYYWAHECEIEATCSLMNTNNEENVLYRSGGASRLGGAHLKCIFFIVPSQIDAGTRQIKMLY